MRRKILIIKKKEKISFVKMGKRFGMSPNTIFQWTKKLEPQARREKAAIKIDMEALKEDIKQNPESYQYERAIKFKISKTGMWHAIKRLGVTYKKNFKTSKSGRKKAYYI